MAGAESFFESSSEGLEVKIVDVMAYLQHLQRTDPDLFWKKVTLLVAQNKQLRYDHVQLSQSHIFHFDLVIHLRRMANRARKSQRKMLRVETSSGIPTWDQHVSLFARGKRHTNRLLEQMTPSTPPPLPSPQQTFCGGNFQVTQDRTTALVFLPFV